MGKWFVYGLRNRSRPILAGISTALHDLLPDSVVLSQQFQAVFHRPLDWQHPKTFNEKLLWLNRYHRPPILTQLADKYAVREFVSARVGSEVLNELYGVWDRVDRVPFDALPDAFVLKVTGGSAMNVVCRDRTTLNVAEVSATLAHWLSRNYYWKFREWPYKNIPPRIVAERLLVDETGASPTDYKFFCFDGVPRFIQVDHDRFTAHTRSCYDVTWMLLPFSYQYPHSSRPTSRPDNLDGMIEISRALSRGFPFVRVDLYSLQGRTVFGEMTWYPEAGLGRFTPETYDRLWGDALRLPTPAGH